MKTVLFTIVLLLSGTAMASERTRGLLGDMPVPDSAESPNRYEQFMQTPRGQELQGVMDLTIKRDPRANEALEAYQKRYNVPSVQENRRARIQRWNERERSGSE